MIAEARAKAIAMVAEAINGPGGEKAVKTQLVEEYVKQLGEILEKSKVSVVPTEVANIRGALEGVSHVASGIQNGGR